MEDCVFCKIIAKQIPATVVAQNDEVLVIKDIAPKAPIHYLIIPKVHIKDVASLQRSQCCLVSKMVRTAQEISQKDAEHANFKLVVNNGHAAGQHVFHLHMHFLAGKQFDE